MRRRLNEHRWVSGFIRSASNAAMNGASVVMHEFVADAGCPLHHVRGHLHRRFFATPLTLGRFNANRWFWLLSEQEWFYERAFLMFMGARGPSLALKKGNMIAHSALRRMRRCRSRCVCKKLDVCERTIAFGF